MGWHGRDVDRRFVVRAHAHPGHRSGIVSAVKSGKEKRVSFSTGRDYDVGNHAEFDGANSIFRKD